MFLDLMYNFLYSMGYRHRGVAYVSLVSRSQEDIRDHFGQLLGNIKWSLDIVGEAARWTRVRVSIVGSVDDMFVAGAIIRDRYPAATMSPLFDKQKI